MPIYHELKITDGTTVINLLNLPDGYSVAGHRQAIAQYKGGGSWSQSALGDGGQLAYYAYDDAMEAYPITAIVTGDPAPTIAALADLLALLRKCADYWVDDYKSEPVWVQCQAYGEPATRYAIIKAGTIPDLGNPYEEPWISSAALEGIELTVRRGHWRAQAPKLSTPLEISGPGNVDDADVLDPITTDGVFVNNCSTNAVLTHQYRYTDPFVYSANMIGLAVPYQLIGIALNDAAYFGIIDTGAAQRVPFNNLVFDIGTPQVGTDIIWEYYNGAAFVVLPNNWADSTCVIPTNYTDSFDRTGVGSVAWEGPANWVAVNLFTFLGGLAPNVRAFWVRARVTNAGAQAPIQQNRRVYFAGQTYLEVQASEVVGQLPAICKLIAHNRSETSFATPATNAETARIIGGVRDEARGDLFHANVNLGGVQNAASVAVTPAATVSLSAYPALLVARGQLGGAGNVTLAAVQTLGDKDYYGRFRVFVRYKLVAGVAGSVTVYLTQRQDTAGTGGVIHTSETLVAVAGEYQLFDFGEFTIPGILPLEIAAYNWFNVEVVCSDAGGCDIYGYDMIFMPIDEYTFDISDFDADLNQVAWPQYVIADSIIDPKRIMRTIARTTFGVDLLKKIWLSVAAAPMQREPGLKQRIWFLTSDYTGSEIAYPFNLNSMQMESVTRYIGLREV